MCPKSDTLYAEVISLSEDINMQIQALNQQFKELAAIYHQAAMKCGISDSEFWVLYALLVLDAEYSQQDICDRWSLPKQTVNSVITNLVKKGYVFLEIIPGTRNKKIIRLTQTGKEFADHTISYIIQAELRAAAKLSHQERETYIALLAKYSTLLQEEIVGNYSL